ncbi:anti-sigma factor [Aestuariibius sp. HNIBRBA575]|uniref:anti-sigma factor family protein n=1 Tax=Aestuariibius sp. HNIBRBA575 TaxID=3233343 RepID=UPI0034A1F916
MTQRPDITDDMLHAFVDGQLDDADMARVESWLNEHPEKAEEIADWDAQNHAIQSLFPAQESPLSVKPIAANQPTAPSGNWMGRVAAMLAVLGLGMAGGWVLRGPGSDVELTARLVGDAMSAHVVFAADPHRPVELAASEEDLLIRWLSNRVGHTLATPDLSAHGFDLVGGRLLSVAEGPAAQFMYENAAGQRITLFAVQGPTTRVAEFSYDQNGPVNSFYWQDENLRYAVVGDIPRDDLSAVAVTIFDALS